MAKKTVDWMKKTQDTMIQQFDQFTLKVPSYATLFSLTPGQITGVRNDYLWGHYSVVCTAQYEQELKNRFGWRDNLLNGPLTLTVAQVPSIGTEFPSPVPAPVADGILPRWRQLVEQIKGHPAYTQAIGDDLGIEAVEGPAQSTKPIIRTCTEDGGTVILNVLKDGHDSMALFCRRGAEPAPSLVGIYTRSRIEDTRPTLVSGQPEIREYTAQYRDGDKPVGQISDVCILTKQP